MKEEAYQHLLATVIKNARRAVNANNAKSDFISNLSYELRTTLANIIGMAQLLSMDCLLPKQQRYVTDILEASEAILPLVNRLLNLSELEAQHIEQFCSFNLKHLLEKVINQLSYQAGMRRLQLILDYPENIPLFWIGDPNLIYHILFHLSSHALINTEQGMVIIQVVNPIKEFVSLQSEIIFSIKDTGKGMDEAELLALKACFKQVNHRRRYKTFNLGLSIILSYLRVLKATLEVESTLGKGSHYICRIPLKELKEPLDDDTYTSKKNSLAISTGMAIRLLVVEDNEILRRIYSSFLEKQGIVYDMASNAEVALKYYMQKQYDLILIDIALPDSDGMAITQIIRHQEAGNEHIPIIALTAYGQPTDVKQFLQAGIDEVLIKPIKIEEINYLLEKWIQPKVDLNV